MIKVPKIEWHKFTPEHPPTKLCSFCQYLVVIKETRDTTGDWYHLAVGKPFGNTVDDFWDVEDVTGQHDWLGDSRTVYTVVAYAYFPQNCLAIDLIKY